MKQSKFSLADVLTVLTAISFGFVCFLGAHLYTLGDTSQSIIMSGIIALLLGGLAFIAKLLKRTSRNFKTSFILEMAVLVLFTGLTVFFAYSPFPHYFNVSAKKAEIKKGLTASIMQAENMFVEYEHYVQNRKNLYESKLRSVAGAKNVNPNEYIEYGFVSGIVSDDMQIENKIFSLGAELFPTNYSGTTDHQGIKQVATDWLAKAKSTTNNWRPIGIVNVVNKVEQNSEEWLSHLVTLSSKQEPKEEATVFTYELAFDNLKRHFTELGNPTGFSIGLAVGAYLLMLLSWLVTKRHTRFPGFKLLFGTGETDNNEL